MTSDVPDKAFQGCLSYTKAGRQGSSKPCHPGMQHQISAFRLKRDSGATYLLS